MGSGADIAPEPTVGDGSAVQLEGVTKRFGQHTVLADVSLTFKSGEFVALLGSNGAGKSTLIKILDGVYKADGGSITTSNGKPLDSVLGVVHQDLGLIDTLSVSENLFLGKHSRTKFLHVGREAAEAERGLRPVGLDGLDPHALVDSLTLGERALVAVARLLSSGASFVIADEVTAGLPPNEADWLIQNLRASTAQGATVIVVSHKLRELIDVADRFIVLVDGRVALDAPRAEVTLDRLIQLMSGGQHAGDADLDLETSTAGDAMLSLQEVSGGKVGPISLDVGRGEIVGLIGDIGSGVHDVAYLAADLIPVDSGKVVVPHGLRLSCVPPHRETQGVFPEDTEYFNIAAGVWRRWRSAVGLVRVRAEGSDVVAMSDRLNIVPNDLHAKAHELSGGNQQKLVIGRALIRDPDILVLCEPTRGVDVSTRREIYATIRRIAREGKAVLIVTSDMEDLLGVADRAVALGSDGTLVASARGSDIALLATQIL